MRHSQDSRYTSIVRRRRRCLRRAGLLLSVSSLTGLVITPSASAVPVANAVVANAAIEMSSQKISQVTAGANKAAGLKSFTGGKVAISGNATACEIVGKGFQAGCKGSTLTATISGLSPSDGISYTYQWYRDGAKISGATSKKYTLSYPADAAAKISVKVIANKAGYAPLTLTSKETSEIRAVKTKVVNVGGQEAIDVCMGGLTHMESITRILGQMYLPIENACGGEPLLALEIGQIISIVGIGDLAVVDLRDVAQGSSTAAVRGISGSYLLQTCHSANSDTSNLMRVIGLELVA